MSLPHATLIGRRIVSDCNGITVQSGDEITVDGAKRFSRDDTPANDLPACRVGTIGQTRDNTSPSSIVRHTYVVELLYSKAWATNPDSGVITDEIDEAFADAVVAIAGLMTDDQALAGQFHVARWAPFHRVDSNAGDYGVRVELEATWRQNRITMEVIS